jgi:hypothetical protein
MRGIIFRRRLISGFVLAAVCSMCPAFGQDNAGESTWKFVPAPESTEDVSSLPIVSSPWDEAIPPSVPAPQEAAPQQLTYVPPPAPTLPSTPPILRPRPIIPSKRLAAANRGERSDQQFSEEQIRAAINFVASSGDNGGQPPRRAPTVPSPMPSRRQGKPFQNMTEDPTISPWLNLDRSEDLEELPNYYAFVRPQLDQMRTNDANQQNLLHLQREVQNVSTAVVGPQYGNSGLGPTGHTARYMDTAQYYGRWGN